MKINIIQNKRLRRSGNCKVNVKSKGSTIVNLLTMVLHTT